MTDSTTDRRELSRLGRWCLVLGGSLIVLFATVFAAAVIGLAVGIQVGWWLVVPAAAAQAGFTAVAFRQAGEPRLILKVAVVVAVGWIVIVTAGAVSGLGTDHSVDGRHYHSETAWAIADGWNPLRDGPLYPSGSPIQPDSFAKAQAVTAATVLRITHDVDTTRLVGATLLLAAALLAVATLEAAGARTWLALTGGVVLALNPVAVAQLGTTMVDGIVSSLLLATVALSLLWVWRHPPVAVLPALAGALVLLVNTKLTGLVYVGIIVVPLILFAGILAGLGRRLVPMIGGLLLATLVATFALGYNPYVTNTLRHDHPLYPVYGTGSRDIGALYLTDSLKPMSDPERLVRSIFNATSVTPNLHVKVPLTFSTAEWSTFRSAGPRFGGFGPLFSGGLLIAGLALIAGLLAKRFQEERVNRPVYALLGFAALCLVSTLVQPYSFVARFAPQLWFVAPLIAISVLLAITAKVVRVIAWVALGVLLLDTLGVGGFTAAWSVRTSRREEAGMARLRAQEPLEAQFFSWRVAEERRLHRYHVRFRPVKQVTCPVPFFLSVSGSLKRRIVPLGVPLKTAALLCPIPRTTPPG